jgi:hypothetical protein
MPEGRIAIIFGPHFISPLTQTIPRMNKIKNLVFSALLTLGAFGAVTFTSCSSDDSPVDPCAAVVCQNNGVCDNNGACSCPAGYEGTLCETTSRNRILNSGSTATFTVGVGQDGCYNPGYTMTINPGANVDEIIINNFAGYGTSATVSGLKVNGRNFTQTGTITTGAVTLSNITGSISEDGRTLTYSYRAADAVRTVNCSATATKQ